MFEILVLLYQHRRLRCRFIAISVAPIKNIAPTMDKAFSSSQWYKTYLKSMEENARFYSPLKIARVHDANLQMDAFNL